MGLNRISWALFWLLLGELTLRIMADIDGEGSNGEYDGDASAPKPSAEKPVRAPAFPWNWVGGDIAL